MILKNDFRTTQMIIKENTWPAKEALWAHSTQSIKATARIDTKDLSAKDGVSICWAILAGLFLDLENNQSIINDHLIIMTQALYGCASFWTTMFTSSLETIPWGIQKAKIHHSENTTNCKYQTGQRWLVKCLLN